MGPHGLAGCSAKAGVRILLDGEDAANNLSHNLSCEKSRHIHGRLLSIAIAVGLGVYRELSR